MSAFDLVEEYLVCGREYKTAEATVLGKPNAPVFLLGIHPLSAGTGFFHFIQYIFVDKDSILNQIHDAANINQACQQYECFAAMRKSGMHSENTYSWPLKETGHLIEHVGGSVWFFLVAKSIHSSYTQISVFGLLKAECQKMSTQWFMHTFYMPTNIEAILYLPTVLDSGLYLVCFFAYLSVLYSECQRLGTGALVTTNFGLEF